MKRWHTRTGVGVWLALAVLLALTAWRMFAHGFPLQTNILSLLPATERNPVAEQAVTALASAAGDRAVFLVGNADSDSAARDARVFAAALRESGAFKGVIADVPPVDLRAQTAIYRDHRYTLLSDADRAALQQGGDAMRTRLQQSLQQKLYAPFQFGIILPLAEDPFGLTGNWLATLPLATLKLQPELGLLMRRDGGMNWVFVSAELAGSSYDAAAAHAGVQAVSAAENALAPQGKLLRTGAMFYSDAARTSGEREVHIIGAGSLLGMLALLWLMFRSPRPLLLGLFSVAFGIGAAIVGSVAAFGELHLITLVFGAALIGEAIDYSIQYFAAHLGAGAAWEPLAGLRRIAPGLAVALATSLLGYAVLSFSPFPALKQIALFALLGLGAAWLTVFLLLPGFLVAPNRRDPVRATALPRRMLAWWQTRLTRRRCLMLIAAIPVLSAPGWLMLSSDDDVRQLIARPPQLQAEEARIRDLTGFGGGTQFFLVEGASPDEVLAREEVLTARLAPLAAEGRISGSQALSAFVPSARKQAENHRLWGEAVAAAPPVLTAAGLKDEVGAGMLREYQGSTDQPLLLEAWLATPMATPLRHLWLGHTVNGYASLVVPLNIRSVAAVAPAGAGLPGITFVDKAGSITALFGEYRHAGALWLAGALVLVFLVLLVRYSWRQAIFVLAPTVLAAMVTVALFGYLGKPATLFNVMGMMLVLGIGVNYAIFLREGGVNAAATLAGVALSAGTTLLGFGLLAFSSMPALAGFGLTLLIGIALAVMLSPMGMVFAEEGA